MSKPIKLQGDELANLIRESNGRVVSCAFGPGVVAIKPDESAWAIPLLMEWRGITFSDGAGI